MTFQLTHLDAMQGGKEERTSRISNTVSEQQTQADTAVRQGQRQSFLVLPESKPLW